MHQAEIVFLPDSGLRVALMPESFRLALIASMMSPPVLGLVTHTNVGAAAS